MMCVVTLFRCSRSCGDLDSDNNLRTCKNNGTSGSNTNHIKNKTNYCCHKYYQKR